MNFLKIILRFLLGRYAPKWAAALEAGQEAYAAADRKEQGAAVNAKTIEMKQVWAEVETRKEEAHAEVAHSADPDAVVNQQLWRLGLVADAAETGPGDGDPDAPPPADSQDQSG